MRKTTPALFILLLIAALPLSAAAQITSAGVNGVWTDPGTWVDGVVPTSADDVVIAAGDTITVQEYTAECRDVSFGADSAQIKMNSESLLSVYGDFTLFSTSHCVFDEYWSSNDAKIRFVGSAEQILAGWSTSGGSTSFRDVIVDKDGGKLTTDGSGMRLGIQNSLEIVQGLFELAESDDLEGRWATSGNYTGNPLPDVTIQVDGEFYMVNGASVHHIRSDYDSGTGTSMPIGVFTIYGTATFIDASTIKFNLSGIDVEDGGKLITSTGMGVGRFECGPLHIKAGGEVEHYTTSDCWGTSAVVTLDAGGQFDTKASTTVFPAVFTNNGQVRYSREATTDQTVVDMDYTDLLFSLDSDNNKNWELADNRTVSGTLRVNYDANLVLTADASQSLNVGSLLWLTSGQLDNSDADVALTMADGAMIQRAAGALTDAPFFAGLVDVRYTSNSVQVTTGPEVPAATGVIDDFEVSGDAAVDLGADIEVGGVCTTSGNDLITGPYIVTLGPAASLVESPGLTVLGTVSTSRTVSQSVNEIFGGIGLEVLAAGAAPGLTDIVRTTGPDASKDASTGIKRVFDIAMANNAGLDATVNFHYDESELDGLAENTLAVFSFNGLGWDPYTSSTDPAGDVVTAPGLDSFTKLTLSTEGAVPTMLQTLDVVARGSAIDISWRTFEPIRAEDYRITRYEIGGSGVELENRVIVDDAFSFSFIDDTCGPGKSYRYRVEVSDESGSWVLFETQYVETPLLGAQLAQNHPNPFNPSTDIQYTLPAGGHVVLDIFDVSGSLVHRLVDAMQERGTHSATWTGVDQSGRPVPSGVYFYMLSTGDELQMKKMMLVR